MGIFIWKILILVSLYPLFFSCVVSATSTPLMSNLTQDDFNICNIVYCGRGTCHPSSTDILGFRCDCESGWTKPNLGSFQLPTCSLPNCTFDLNCGNASASLPSSPPKVADPCLLNLCGDGTCEREGFDFSCHCNEGSSNLFNDPKLICIKTCNLVGQCDGFDLGFNPSPSETPKLPAIPTNNNSPPISSSSSPAPAGLPGSCETVRCRREVHMIVMLILTLIFEIWN